ncbi:DNA cross-link repair protein PSO2/SNM1 [Diatrype stigma]|uniref:DNA cross-link repair protein PSO2/SNM1 n=1 Tax=Diatrype stigma TaxID=117547 RepID=A0AAN9USP7_9PEZI
MPSKTTSKPMTPRTQSKLNFKPNSAAKTASSAKKSSKPANGNILNFFKKVEVEEQLFCGGPLDSVDPADSAKPTNPASRPTPGALDTREQDDDDVRDVEDNAVEKRYNEHQNTSKRRKLSRDGDHEDRVSSHASTSEASTTSEPRNAPEATKPTKAALKASKPRKVGPFLEDSDSDGEDDGTSESRTKETPHDSLPDIRIPNLQAQSGPSLNNELSPITDDPPVIKPHAPPIKHEDSSSVHADLQNLEEMEALFDDDDNEFDNDGEEFRERRYMEEQAKLEAEEAEAGNYVSDCALDDAPAAQDNAITESCPICNANLAGIGPEQASIHVNACLDGTPIPLPAELKPPPSPPAPPALTVDAPDLGKRFARAAVPRPGQANPISLSGSGSGGNSKAPTSAFSKLMSGHAEDSAWALAAAAENASRGKPAYQRTCPFYKIMPGFFICVDAFRYGAVKGCNAYFLSHFHSDHYIGLTANWSHGPIYCSKVTGSLIRNQLRTDARWIVPIEFEEKVEIPGTQGVTVTMIPANHCPGSSLFLFEKALPGGNGPNARAQRILHCGDFRACPAQVAHPLLRPETIDAVSGRTRQQKIDVCYLDTTYLNPRYSFPPQDDVIRACAEFCRSIAEDPEAFDARKRGLGGKGGRSTVVSQFFPKENSSGRKEGSSAPDKSSLKNSGKDAGETEEGENKNKSKSKDRLLVVCGTYSIGKERICKAIAQALHTKIFASPAKARLCRQLGDPELAALLTDDPRAAQVHMQALAEIRAETLQAYLDGYKPHFTRIVGFRPSGWSFRAPSASTSAIAKDNGTNITSVGGGIITASANLQPSAVPTTAILHGPAWRPRFSAADLAAQRGSTREAACFGVPYSEHSSFRELALFLMALRVERVVPTVNVGSEPGRRRMKAWTDRWLAERRRGGIVRIIPPADFADSDPKVGAEGKEGGNEEGEEDVRLWDGKDGKGGGVRW